MQSILVMCPLIYQIQHSFNPNCYLDGCYFSHENMSYVEVSSKRPIEPGEALTINYGDLPNLDLMIRHGLYVPGNPFNEMHITLDFSNHLAHAGEGMEKKQQLLRMSPIKDIERVVVYKTKVNVELL